MAKCKQCGKKLSLFEPSQDGLCAECMRLASPGAIEKMKHDEEVRQSIIDAEAERKANLQRQYDEKSLPTLECLTPKALEIEGGNLVFVSKKKRESVPISNIASITAKSPGFGTNGVITVKLQKGNDGFIGVGGMAVGLGSEVSAVVNAANWELAQMYVKYINNYDSIKSAPTDFSASPADELRKLKELVDEGILTEEEFTAKKKQLLGI